jgi:hypothetical protein
MTLMDKQFLNELEMSTHNNDRALGKHQRRLRSKPNADNYEDISDKLNMIRGVALNDMNCIHFKNMKR